MSRDSDVDTRPLAERRRKQPSKSAGASGAPKFHAGELLADKYRLERPLGEGGMGSVWLANHETLGTEVAIKLVHGMDETAGKRMLTEARAAASLHHRSIVRVFDFGFVAEHDPFIVMEVVRGRSLAEILDREGELEVNLAVQMMLPVASALRAAHAHGIVHRDVKPENIILEPDFRGGVCPKLVDFGLARETRRGDAKSRITAEGMVMGTPAYQSPEQAIGKMDVDHRTDVWAFCVVLYEALCGVRPFEGSSPVDVTWAVIKNEPPSLMKHGVGDERLWKLIERGLRKERDERWPSMDPLGTALATWAIDQGLDHDVTGSSIVLQWLRKMVDTGPLSGP